MVDPTVMDPTVLDPSVLDPHVLEPSVLEPNLDSSPRVVEPLVSDVRVQEPKVDVTDVEQEQKAIQDGQPLLRQQPGPDAPQTPKASAAASLAFNTAMHLQNRQYSNAENYVVQQTNQAQYQVNKPCFTAGTGCMSTQLSGRKTKTNSRLQRGVHVWSRPSGTHRTTSN